ncbi:Pentatricopeptide repeat [Parasponia andersonii]|uniref:Pentatricopeptide repeat n=1 Tax=Parasponia andersonii TaxID=3476 RepID=A0A2P5AAF2_PARAD|nr:Pentatricopeptide repeat [Parasponia andersonii]
MKSRKGLNTTEPFKSMLSWYCKYGVGEKASGIYREIGKHGYKPNSITYRHLPLGCLKVGMVEEALKLLEMGLDLTTSNVVRNSAPWLETTLSIVGTFAGKGDVENAEKLFDELKKAFHYGEILKL